MRIASCVALAITLLGIGNGSSTGIVGAVYSASTTGNRAAALPGALVYVHLLPIEKSDWIGPSVTDQYGRFAFPNSSAGQYLLRVFLGPRKIWEQAVTAPVVLDRLIVHDFEVWYYPKSADKVDTVKVLRNAGYQVTEQSSANDLATNIVWFGDSVTTPEVKALVLALIAGGVDLHAVRRFATTSPDNTRLVEVGSSPDHVKGAVLTADDITAATTFPRAESK